MNQSVVVTCRHESRRRSKIRAYVIWGVFRRPFDTVGRLAFLRLKLSKTNSTARIKKRKKIENSVASCVSRD